jgi:hypothetical protein
MSLTRLIMIAGPACTHFGGYMLVQPATVGLEAVGPEAPRVR